MYAKFSKCEFFKDKIRYLGHVKSKEGILVDPDKIRTIMKFHVPKDVSDVQLFMGITGYYQKFVEGFSKIVNPITSLEKKGKNICMGFKT